MEWLCLHQHLQPCPQTLDDAPKKAAQKIINWLLRLTKRICRHERLKSAKKLKRFFTPRLTIRRHGERVSERRSRFNDTNKTDDSVLDSSDPNKHRVWLRGPKGRTRNTYADWFSRKWPITIYARKEAFIAWMRSKCSRSLAGMRLRCYWVKVAVDRSDLSDS
jgi:hypothetical protein